MRSCSLLMMLIGAGLLLSPAQSANLLDSYLPVCMQALAYYIDLLQYEPLHSTTAEPPFSVNQQETSSTTPLPFISTTTSTTRTPTGGWWQWDMPQTTTTTPRPIAAPTVPHGPALFAPPAKAFKTKQLEGQQLFLQIKNDVDFDKLPLSLIRDIETEPLHDDFTNDVESLDNFLRLYDDNYGRAVLDFDTAMDRWSSSSTAGKKRVPPTKPYVDFLLVYDLLKRDAKAANLSKYEGYSDDLLQQLQELSNGSSVRQLHTIFQRLLDRGDVQRSDVVARIQGILKDLGSPKSATAQALVFIPSMQFLS
ncbi:ImpE3 [Drosophila busckii]|uniref:ImpE3 n=1 Tax=Drosophila busckii TaxID=30019 RepID=A0A0M4EJQ0_DROBS|nr:uncharacterized protein LOC108602812 [Drosophila busckii]ALC47208.1 ImpE3 [Drosophila busckii]